MGNLHLSTTWFPISSENTGSQVSPVFTSVCIHNNTGVFFTNLPIPCIINPQRACAMKITVVVPCVCVCLSLCVSVFSILPSQTFRRLTRGISSYSVEMQKKKGFSLKLLSSNVRSVINYVKSAIFFMCRVSIYLSVTRT